VPAIVRWPGVVQPNTEINDIVSAEDWVPGIVNLTGCGRGDAHREAACANNYAAVITLLISAQTRNVCVLEALCSAAVR
jgi:hypothetical protein